MDEDTTDRNAALRAYADTLCAEADAVLTLDTPGVEHICVYLDGVIMPFVREAHCGEQGYILQMTRDPDGNFATDSNGEPLTVRRDGNVTCKRRDDG